MGEDRAHIEDLASRLTRETITTKVRIGEITDIGADTKVQTSITEEAWLPRDQDATLHIGDRVWVLQQGPMMLVAGRLSGVPRPMVIRKSAQQDASSTTLIDADDMECELTPGVWRVELIAHVASAAAADDVDVRLAWTFSGTAPGQLRSSFGPGPASTNIAADGTAAGSGIIRSQAGGLTGATTYGVTDVAVTALQEDLYLEVTVAGILQLQFAQGTASGTVVSLSTGTRMYITPCGVLS